MISYSITQRNVCFSISGSAWILHYSGQPLAKSYKSKLVTPLIESTGVQCLSFDFVSLTGLTVNLIYEDGEHMELIKYTEVSYPLMWNHFSKAILEEVWMKYYLEFVGEKSETTTSHYFLALDNIKVTNSACDAVVSGENSLCSLATLIIQVLA